MLPGAKPLNAGFCGLTVNQSVFVAEWMLDRYPGVRDVLLVVSPQDLTRCKTTRTEVFDRTDADRFVFGGAPRWSYYFKYFDLVALARAGEAAAQGALSRYANRLARALAHVINLLDPDVIILGGGMSNVDELYDWVPRQLPAYVFGGEAETPIVRSQHGDSSGVRGAAWLWPRPDAMPR